MKFEKSQIHKILVITLSHIGDCFLTFPVFDILKRDFPKATLSVVTGPKNEELFRDNPLIDQFYIYQKRQSLRDIFRFIAKLRREKFDLIVDLRNTAFPFFIGGKYKTPIGFGKPKIITIHNKQKHLNRLKTVYSYNNEAERNLVLCIHQSDQVQVDKLLDPFLKRNEKFIVIAPGASSQYKRWKEEGFAKACQHLIEQRHVKIIFVGNQNDEDIVRRIQKNLKTGFLSLCGKTTLTQLANLLTRAAVVIAHDSGVMHMASYLNVPTVAIFGPTDPVESGPWSRESRLVKSTAFCKACNKPNEKYDHECMDAIDAKEVCEAVESFLKG